MTHALEYALVLLGAMAEHEGYPLPIASIAREWNISKTFLQKIAFYLRREGIIMALRGKHGGYILARHLKDISLHEVMSALDHAYHRKACAGTSRFRGVCPRRPLCQMRFTLAPITKRVEAIYRSVSLAHLVNKRYEKTA